MHPLFCSCLVTAGDILQELTSKVIIIIVKINDKKSDFN